MWNTVHHKRSTTVTAYYSNSGLGGQILFAKNNEQHTESRRIVRKENINVLTCIDNLHRRDQFAQNYGIDSCKAREAGMTWCRRRALELSMLCTAKVICQCSENRRKFASCDVEGRSMQGPRV
jgi:hypothetical protein